MKVSSALILNICYGKAKIIFNSFLTLHNFVFDSRSMFLYKLRQSEMSQQENTDFVAEAVRLLNKGWIRVKHMFLIIVLYL